MLFACKKDEKIGRPVPIEQDYKLPQGSASKEANDKIQEFYNTYGSYFLYVYKQKDFVWVPSTGGSNSKIDTAVMGNPVYVMDMLNFLNDVWLKFLPESFKKAQGIPYRVILADTIKQYRPGYPPGREYLYFDYKIIDKAIAFSGMNQSLRTMTAADKLNKKNILTGVIWGYYVQNKIIEIPASFYKVSSYTTAPAYPVNALNPANVEAYRQRGFLPASYLPNGTPSEWYYGPYYWNTAQSSDLSAYILNITTCTDAQLIPYLKYPLIKEKYDLLVDFFKVKYGIDVRAIANATY
ncbi:hypothetical protein CK934_00955 [Chitinophaga sp. MD30]|nr:hypothetical protein CK934_00955 [Chitinophaga sp. MD30]